MTNLESVSGLPIVINEDGLLRFNQPLIAFKPAVRKFKDMKEVLMDPPAPAPFDDMYYMYRNVHFQEHEKMLQEMQVSYDLTLIPPGKIGQEFNKTVGHYHAVMPGTKFGYPEVYEVLNGHALFLLQKMDATFEDLITVIAIEAKAGQKVIYPPNYGHALINVGDEALITSNWVGDNFERVYNPISARHGMAYYVVADHQNGFKFVENPNYQDHPKVRVINDQFMHHFEIMGKGPMYTIGTTSPKSLEFLTKPDKYAVELSSITS
jgi:glucose-6-phosphate isomerase, archaeal